MAQTDCGIMSLHYMIISTALILAVTSQQTPAYYYQSWLYAMPWQPLVIPSPANGASASPTPSPADLQQLSLGYTGPQIFPAGQAAAAASSPVVHRPILLGLLRPHQGQGEFTLPFRPSPFAGYTLDKQDDHDQNQQQQQQQSQQNVQQQHLEPGFFAPGYPQQTPATNPIEEVTDEQQIGEDQQQQHFIYMSPQTLYNLVSSHG